MTTTLEPGVTRRHGVALNADVVGYSAHIADDRTATVESMRHLQKAVTDSVVGAGGVMANFVGDNFLAVFDDATQAIRAAISICQDTTARHATLDEHRRLRLRMGLDSGEMLMAPDGRCFGDPINIAARVQALASPGGINISESVFVDLDEPMLRFESLGPQRLKNIPELVTVYRLSGMGSGAAPTSGVLADATPTVAVMPFEGADELSHQVAQAVQMDIMTALVRLPGLAVMEVVPERESTSDVRYMLLGGALRSRNRIRVYAKVVDVQTVNAVWADRWDGSDADLFELQDRVTRDVVRGFEVELVVGEPARLYRTLSNQKAVERVYRGWQFLTSGSLDITAWRGAIEQFDAIMRDEPSSPVGPGLLAFTYWFGVLNAISLDPEEDSRHALEMAERGIALDDGTGLSHMVKAALRMSTPAELTDSLELARTAALRRPTCDITYAVEATIERYRGNWDRAAEAARRAIALSPVARAWYRTILAGVLHGAGRHREAADLAQELVDLEPRNLDAHLVLASAQHTLGQTRRAAATVALIADRFPRLDLDRFRRRHPFADESVMQAWLDDLAACGVRWSEPAGV